MNDGDSLWGSLDSFGSPAVLDGPVFEWDVTPNEVAP
jgi:hypothetical protein